jgi:RimJ/RimL family protein N-acetyltransferase
MKTNDRKVCLRLLQHQDIIQIYRWRCDRQVLHLIGRDHDMPRSEERFVENFERQLVSPLARRLLRAITTSDGEFIGYVSLFNVDLYERSAEFSILIGRKDLWDHGWGASATHLFLNEIFFETSLERLVLHTAHFNKRAQRCFQKCGFRVVSNYQAPPDASAYQAVKMAISKDEFIIGDALGDRWIREAEE